MMTALGWVALVVLVAANALFVAAEFGLTSVDRAKLERLAEDGDRRAIAVRTAARRLSFHLSAAQLGITVCSLLLGFVAEPVVADVLRPLLTSVGMPGGAVHAVASVLALLLATFAQMLFGELIPQNLAISNPLGVARAVIPLQRAWAGVGRPVVTVFDGAANAIVRSLGITPRQELRAARTPSELSGVISTSAEEGALDPETARLLRRALSFGSKTAGDVMVARVRIVALRAAASAAELIRTARASGRSCFPVEGADLDDVVGVVHVNRAFGVPRDRRAQVTVRTLMEAPIRVPETLDCDALLIRLSRARRQLAIVVDEYGGTAGLVTVEDLVEELVGQIRDEHDTAEIPEILAHGAQRWSVSGQTHKDAIAELLGVDAPRGPFDTVAGLLMERLGRIPEVGDHVALDGWQLRVTRMDSHRVDRVEISRAAGVEAP